MKRLRLAHLPTPLVRPARLAERLGIELWVKRDDATGGAEGGNKVRKLELLLAAALEAHADTVVTCGGIQSNHARATALCAAALGLRSVLYLRVPGLPADDDGAGIPWSAEVAPLAGNVLLDRLAGAELRLITPASYRERDAVMARGAAALRAAGARPYVIPEGGSNGLGALGYAEAMGEVARQLAAGEAGGRPFDLVVHAASSGGTAAGVALGAAKHRVAGELRAFAVSDDAATTTARVVALLDEARACDATLGLPVRWSIDERARGPAYAVATPEQREHIAAAARLGGLVLDPVYTGKAFSGLWDLCRRGELRGERVLFVHTGGLPGLLAEAATFADVC
ncbi:MAG: pyridoxal-phosphate dependent enzyme [Polyangiaceae bacterium]|nr:pyridoxal-phosphate dependent enzyme [Polyangiaceae bacterium]